ncbi:MAG: hypothetical protein GOU98_01665 [Candidatus Altiarchaeota archaeon]|nr:hypothetical protein [Candidatus Altiarchaeota archaeon]
MIIRKTAYGTDFVGLFTLFSGKEYYYPKLMPKPPHEGIEISTDSNLLGMFFEGNKNGIVGTENADLKVTKIETKYTALGNLICATDKGAVISPLIENKKKEIENALKVKASVTQIAGIDIIGSLVLANNKGAVVHPNASETEMDIVAKALKVHVDQATILRSGFLGSMAVANDDILIITPSVMAPEMAQIAEILEID